MNALDRRDRDTLALIERMGERYLTVDDWAVIAWRRFYDACVDRFADIGVRQRRVARMVEQAIFLGRHPELKRRVVEAVTIPAMSGLPAGVNVSVCDAQGNITAIGTVEDNTGRALVVGPPKEQ